MEMENQDFPYRIVEVELSRPLPNLTSVDQEKGFSCKRALLLVRMHSYPIGTVEVELSQKEAPTEIYTCQIWQELGEAINAHLLRDGFTRTDKLDECLSTCHQKPTCLLEREQFVADAPDVSILVATHNRPDQLAHCLDSLLALDYPRFEIIVIDNAPSNDETEQMIVHDYQHTCKVRYVREDVPGLARAHNRGLEVTQAPYIAITDDDVRVDRHWLTELMKGFSLAERVGCVTGAIFPIEIHTKAQYWIEHSAGFSKGYQRRIYDLKDNRPEHPLFPYAAGMFGSGANMAFDTRILREVGGFDDGLGAGSMAMGGDDLASFFQIVADGYTLVYEPAAIVYHKHYREYTKLCKTAYGYGAGLTAYLTKTLLERPSRFMDIARRLPYGLYYALHGNSPKNARKTVDYPRELNWLERKGMAAGPLLYLRSRHKMNCLQKKTCARSQDSNISKGGIGV